MELTEEEIRGIIVKWFWQPQGSTVFDEKEFHLSLWKLMPEKNVVSWFDTEEPDRIVDIAEKLVVDSGRKHITWHCKPGYRPPEMAQTLTGRGYDLENRLEYLYFDLGEGREPILPGLKSSAEAEVVGCTRIEDFTASLRVSEMAFESPVADEETIRERAASQMAEHRRLNDIRVNAVIGGVTAGTAGATVEDAVLKLWGGGTHPDYRSRGVYGSLTLARCKEGFRHGARYALVTARESTSVPILTRAGFRQIGSEYHYVRKL